MKKTKQVTASDLAEMGFCEKRVLLQARYGKRTSLERRHAQQRGLEAHAAFHLDGVRTIAGVTASGSKPWCFIATAVYGGKAPETSVLRQFRDQVLRRTVVGRQIIVRYYQVSPVIADWLDRHPLAARVTRVVLRPVIGLASLALQRQRVKRIATLRGGTP
ncbi:hypothetical protein GJ700_02515 [Duganella sp. FT92W]|uniref:Uncharacterized protein n=2 Tax=Pseudoduganella rivuli TaxID=2666085 RepID=A0A7X2LS50_9BURK|nr:hypothetical protein [Pseudoduganella rivuli]